MNAKVFGDFFSVTPLVASIIQIVEIILAAVILAPCSVLFAEIFLAFLNRHKNTDEVLTSFENKHCKRAILVPAHNEAIVIETSLSSIKSQIRSTDQLIVIADNCTDDTAAIAQRAGATVIDRHNEQQRGKGYALDFGLRYLSQDLPDIVIMIDADCQVQS